MSELAEKLKVELARLTCEERSEILDFLLDGLEAEGICCGQTEVEFVAELMRREEEIRSGKAVGVAADVVIDELR